MRPKTKTKTYRRRRAQDVRDAMAGYKAAVDDSASYIGYLADAAGILSNLVQIETNGSPAVSGVVADLHRAYRELRAMTPQGQA